MDKKEFIPTIAPIVQKVNNELGNPLFSSVVIAQAICESGWGQSKIMMNANAIFGIKATKDWQGKVYNANTQEFYDKYVTVKAGFRAYDSLEDSIRDYFKLITSLSRYKKAINSSSPLECITAIKNGGYATSPTYIETIMSIIKSNNLTKYDEVKVDYVTYTVKRGDNLSSIARVFNTTWQVIYNLNKDVIGSNPNLIYANQKLVIPRDSR